MDNPNHNQKEYTPEEVASIVERSPQAVRGYAKENKIDHRRIGRMFIISEKGLEQTKQIVATSKPGPKGPRKKSPARKAA